MSSNTTTTKPTFAMMAKRPSISEKAAESSSSSTPTSAAAEKRPSISERSSNSDMMPTTTQTQQQKQQEPKAPPTPPLTDPVTSGRVSPDEDKWRAISANSPRRGSLPTIALEKAHAPAVTTTGKDDSSLRSLWGTAAPNIWNDNSVTTQSLKDDDDESSMRRKSLKPEHLLQNRVKYSISGGDIEEESSSSRRGSSDIYGPKYVPPPQRSRSKSSSAIFGNANESLLSAERPSSPAHQDNLSIWANATSRDASLLRRRSSTQPNFNSPWENKEEGSSSLNIPSAGQLAGYRMRERRFSHAPTLPSEYAQQLISESGSSGPGVEEFAMEMRRRHSLAGPLYAPGSSDKYLAEALQNLNLDENAPTYSDIDDYFENTEHRTRAWVEAGNSLKMQSFSQHWPLLVVEFKAGRHDFFFIDDASVNAKKGDLVIVEADRGKDLGKIIHDNIQNMEQLQLYQQNHVDLMAESSFGKDVHPKRIYRLATPADVAMLVLKSQDEAKAMSICQAKIRQKKLPMEVVDAEYQWDRRKLTLYFVAERRIDFRELVRDLFKIYKTRIWMCAVNPAKLIENAKGLAY